MRRGSRASSAAIATPSIARKNQIAKGSAANMPPITAVPITRRAYAQIALAGPLVGWFASALCYLIYTLTFDRLWAALAHTGAWLNLLNLIPVWLLDGSRAVTALGAVERAALLATTLGLWYYSGENVYFFVAAGVTWSLFAKDKPEHGDWNVWLAFVAILAAIGFLIHATPTHLFQ